MVLLLIFLEPPIALVFDPFLLGPYHKHRYKAISILETIIVPVGIGLHTLGIDHRHRQI